MTAYYNEFDSYAAAWLRELIKAGHIAPGDVDERSIEDVRPNDLRGYTQCHFFAGIGVWSYALRGAGWADDRPIWTASCPCQPFSAAGAGAGFADERHLWPAFHHLVEQLRPAIVVGEQVASKAVDAWIDLVHADVEALGYTFGSVPFPSAGVGAPHIRDRNYWVAYSSGQGLAQRQRQPGVSGGAFGAIEGQATVGASVRGAGGLAYAEGRDSGAERQQCGGQQRQQPQDGGGSGISLGGLADSDSGRAGREPGIVGSPEVDRVREISGQGDRIAKYGGSGADGRPGPTSGFWRPADWLSCRDGKWRPVEPGTFPLAHGAASRVGRLRGYGNAINAEAARVWIETVIDCLP